MVDVNGSIADEVGYKDWIACGSRLQFIKMKSTASKPEFALLDI